MANYHVKVNQEGIIHAGTFNEDGNWNHKSEVTTEALEAVRDHLLIMTVKEEKPMAFAWQYPNGKTLILKLEEQPNEIIQDKKEEQKEEKKDVQ